MSTSKELTAKVKLDISDAESKLRKLSDRIGRIQNIINNYGRRGSLERQIERQAIASERLQQATNRTAITEERLAQAQMRTQQMRERATRSAERQAQLEEQQRLEAIRLNNEWRAAHPLLTRIGDQLRVNRNQTSQWGNQVTGLVSGLNNRLNQQRSIVGGLWSTLKGLAATYLGIMGIRTATNAADQLIGAQNRLNYVNAKSIGDDQAYDSSGGYSTKVIDMTKDSMDKMYAIAQKARTSYSDMMNGVSKTMTLASEAFKDNIDNAIRFEEIMSEAYAIAGASGPEMQNSMYQLRQALASGRLAGDELKSVMENAPLAYRAIEEYVQGVYEGTEYATMALNDLGAEGLVTSDMIVAGILNSGEEMDKAFQKSAYTFDQVWTQITNSAKYAFQPVLEMLKATLQEAADTDMIDKFEQGFKNLAKMTMILMESLKRVVQQWDTVKHFVVGAIMLMITWNIIKAGIGVAAAYLEWKANVIAAHGSMQAWWAANSAAILGLAKIIATVAIVALAIMALVYVVYLWGNGTIDTCQAVTYALLIVGAAVLLIGLMFNITALLAIGAILLILGILFMFFAEICGIAWGILTLVVAVFQTIGNFFASLITLLITWALNFFIFISNGVMGVLNVIGAVCTNIEIAFSNAWNGAKAAFWDFIADCLDGLKDLETPINAIAKALGAEGFTLSGITATARGNAESARGNMRDYVDVGDAWNKGTHTNEYLDWLGLTEKASTLFGEGVSGWSWNDSYQDGYNAGKLVETLVGGAVNNWGSKYQNQDSGSLLDKLGKKLGLDFDGMWNEDDLSKKLGTSGFPDANDPRYSLNTDPFDDIAKGVGKIGDDTGSMKDSLELSEEDLSYLRKLANMEWKKEYTTAEIKVEMTNHNQVNKDSDLDGIVTKLTDKLYEELAVFADGVYA